MTGLIFEHLRTALVVILLLALAGCAGGGDDRTGPAATDEAATGDDAIVAEDEASDADDDDAPGVDSEGGTPVEGVTVAHDSGEVELEGEVERVVSTSDETTELLVALGIRPVGIASTRVDATAPEDERFADYYLSPEQLGDPTFVGGEELDLEAIAGLEPDLVVHGDDDGQQELLAEIAPTVVYDIQPPGAWQVALVELGVALDREVGAADAISSYEELVSAAAERLAPVVEVAPRLSMTYPNYRAGEDNFVFDADFALAAVVPELGFELVGADVGEPAFPGVFLISSEAWGSLADVTDTIVAVGTTPWRATQSGPLLENVGVPVVGVPLDEGRPSTGPLTAPTNLRLLEEALLEQHG